MSFAQIYVLIPLIIIASASVVLMLAVGIKRSYTFASWFAAASFLAAAVSIFFINPEIPIYAGALLRFDAYASFFWGLIFFSSILIVMISYEYFNGREEKREEFYIILLIASLGSAILAASVHFVSFFLGLEILSVSLYVLISYLHTKSNSVEAGIKYLVLAAMSSAFLLFGMALLYTATGTMEFRQVAINFERYGVSLFSLAGIALMTVGIGFKLAAVPFHMWTSDVYQGAPAPITAFIASVSKGGMFALVFRLFVEFNVYRYDIIITIFSVIAVASMLAGNLLALSQNNVKRILAYSSIAHIGYLLVALIAGGQNGVEASTFYLTAYFITIIGAFAVITMTSDLENDSESIENYRGLFWRKPLLASVFTAMLLSLAGIPLTAGFIGKFYVAASGVFNSLWLLVFILVVSSVIGLYYYLRIIAAMFSAKGQPVNAADFSYSFGGAFSLVLLTLLLFWFGLAPSGILQIIRNSVIGLYY